MRLQTGHPLLITLTLTLFSVGPNHGDPTGTSLFADLTVEELNAVLEYLYQQTTLTLVRLDRARLTDASVFLVEAIRPPKLEALRYLDGSGPMPQRAARAVILRGDMAVPQIQEFRVAPIPNPSKLTQIRNPKWRDPIPFSARSSYAFPQLSAFVQLLQTELEGIPGLLADVTGTGRPEAGGAGAGGVGRSGKLRDGPLSAVPGDGGASSGENGKLSNCSASRGKDGKLSDCDANSGRNRKLSDGVDGSGGYGNCTAPCVTWLFGVPAAMEAGHHKATAYLVWDVEGPSTHPLGLECTVNMDSPLPSEWRVEHVCFQGQHFASFAQLRRARRRGMVSVIPVPLPRGAFSDSLPSSLHFRGPPRPPTPQRGPRGFMPDGPRFTVRGRQVEWMGWEFEFSMLTSSGIQLHNVRFLKERIAWELSLQELSVFYSGPTAAMSHTTYHDSFTIIGQRTSRLFPGIDCPAHAQFFDFVHLLRDAPHVYRDGACVFEHDAGIPLRRHYNSAEDAEDPGSSWFAQGMPDNVLVFRHALSVYNYDYTIDFRFHQAGQIEVKVTMSGYVLSAFSASASAGGPDIERYGFALNEAGSIGVIHHHLLNIKADLDIAGRANRFETLDIHLETIKSDLAEGETLFNRYFKRSLKRTELEAACKFNFSAPAYLIVFNENAKNKFGNPRGYRIISEGMSKMLLPDSYRGSRSRGWTKNQVAVTKYREEERFSSSIYAAAEPFDPVMSFDDYINDDDDIVDEDLVVWITLGTHHIPHSEDIPIVNNVGSQLTFHLVPYNYFDEDPSMASRDNIRVTSSERGEVYQYAGVPTGGATVGCGTVAPSCNHRRSNAPHVVVTSMTWMVLTAHAGLYLIAQLALRLN